MSYNRTILLKMIAMNLLGILVLTVPLEALADDLTSQQVSALKIIRETADSICYTIEQRGSEDDKELNGKIQVKVAGVLSRIAELDVSGGGQLKSAAYQGVLRDQLLPALVHSVNCKNDVFHTLVEKMVPSLAKAVPVAPGLPPSNQLPMPNSVTMTETAYTIVTASNNTPLGRYKLQLYKCGVSSTDNNLTCLIAMAYQAQPYEDQYVDYTIDSGDSIGKARFVDNLNDQHDESGAYFVDGRGQHRQTINLEKDLPVWLALEFQGPFNDVTSGRIVFRDKKAILHIRAVAKQE